MVASAINEDRLNAPWATLTLALALSIAVSNFFLSFIRPWLHKHRTGSVDGYKFVSGIPVIGTVLSLLGLTIGYGATIPIFLAGVATMLDIGGLPWFLFATWRDGSLWDA